MEDSVEGLANKARGYKSALSNPNVPDETKERVRNELDEMDGGPSIGEAAGENNKDPKNVARGLKAAINNPGISDEGKKAAQEKLDNM